MNLRKRNASFRLGLLLAIFGGAAYAASLRAPAPELRVADDGRALRLVPPKAHHFNIGAPMSVQAVSDGAAASPAPLIRAFRADEHEVVFEPKLAAGAQFRVSVYLCDDAKTFCEKHQLSAKWIAKAGGVLPAEEIAPKPVAEADPFATSAPVAAAVARADDDEFIVNDPERAFAQAKREGKPVLIDFFGIWCPPCNEYDEHVFTRPEVRREMDRFVRLKLDADSDVSWKLKERYKIGGYPTIVFAAADGDEIARVVGFRDAPLFLDEVRKAWASRTDDESKLRARADAGDAAAIERLGRLAFERGDYANAVKRLEGRPAARELYEDARIGLLEEKANAGGNDADQARSELRDRLEAAVAAFPDSPRSVERLQKLADLFETSKAAAERKRTLTRLIDLDTRLAKEPARLKDSDITVADLRMTSASAYEDLGQPENAKKLYGEAARELQSRRKRDDERGFNLELAYCLWKSGDTKGAEKIYRSLEDRFPKEFTFYYAHANMSYQLKHLDDAYGNAERAYRYSYGDNRLRAGALRAKILRDRGDKEGARTAIRETLATVKLPEDPANRSHRYVRALKDLDQSLGKS